MPATARQLPTVSAPAEKAGRRLWRKQLLPLGKVEHPKHGTLNFDRDMLSQVASSFKAGAYDVVPFLLANERNEHHDDPEKVRGEVKGVELTEDGLYGLVETSDRGAQLLAENPKLPVSVRLVTPETGPHTGKQVLAHVLGTLDPVAKGLKPWQTIEASADVQLIDLSDGRFTNENVADQPNPEVLSDEEKGTFARLAQKMGFGKTDDSDDTGKDSGDSKDDTLSDEDVDRILADALKDDDTDTSDEKDKEPVTASLSDEDRQKIDMANERADKADVRTGKTELSNRFSQLIRDGVPPAAVQAAQEKLIGGSDEQKRILIDFANEREPLEVQAVFAALEPLKNTVEFTERGSSVGAVDDERKATLDAWEKHSG